MQPWTHYRAQIANRRRFDPTADTSELQRDLRAAKAENYLRGLVAERPALTTEQRLRLVTVLTEAGDPA